MTDRARELVGHAREMREHLSNDLPNGVGNTLDALCDFIEQSLTPPEGDTLSGEVVELVDELELAVEKDTRAQEFSGSPREIRRATERRLAAREAVTAALQSRVSPQAGMREVLREAREALDRLLDYALVHDSGLVEHEEEGKQSPLVTDAKRALATIDKALLAVEGG